MKTELDLIESTSEPLCITTIRKDKPQQMVIITKEQYDMMLSGLDNKGK
jgi:PHD/YefM family antitoxin component YafN of YafNO toxin-antitoxin module